MPFASIERYEEAERPDEVRVVGTEPGAFVT